MKRTAFVVQHVRELAEGSEDVKMIGVYSSKELADAAVDRLRRAPGFCDTPEGFSVEEYELDVDHWTEGFISVAQALSRFEQQ